MKTFELTIAGSCVVSNFSREQAEFFPADVSMPYFNTKDEMKESVKRLLENKAENQKLREEHYKNALPHSFHSRVKELLNQLP